MDDINVNEVLAFAPSLEVDNPEDIYNKSYYHFVKYFEGKDVINEHDLIISANFTYGWMPTILSFKTDDFDSAIIILNQAKSGKRISGGQLETLKKLINNSLVGVSKILHFINPKIYAIWDSRVCNFLVEGKPHKYKVESKELFLSYLNLCERITLDPTFEDVHRRYQQRVGFKITPMRTIEQIMFINSDKPIRP